MGRDWQQVAGVFPAAFFQDLWKTMVLIEDVDDEPEAGWDFDSSAGIADCNLRVKVKAHKFQTIRRFMDLEFGI